MRNPIPHFALVISVLLGGCSFKIRGEAPGGYTFRPSPAAESEVFGGEPPRLGLAISGGGIRSALFSLGVMKAMYDTAALDGVQVLSTVSGGGYNAYWLYSRDLAGPPGRFGQATFEPRAFKLGLCELALHGNFVTNLDMAGSVLNPVTGPRRMYDEKLSRTFGQADSADLQLHQLLPRTRGARGAGAAGGSLPYLVVNSTVWNPEPVRGWADGLYEMTPLFHGNDAWGYEAWDGASVPFRQAVAVSGAAVRPLLQQRVALDPRPSLVLADGGHSENLAAVALVRRRVRDIVVIDGEQDGAYGFAGYTNLRDRLESWGFRLDVPGVDSVMRSGAGLPDGPRLPRGAFVGRVWSTVPGDTYTGRVVYVKLSIPESLLPVLKDSAAVERGDTLYERVFRLLEDSEDDDGDWDCNSLDALDGRLDDFFVSLVHHYSGFNPEAQRTPGRRPLTGWKQHFNTTFPHMSTMLVQSMELDVSTSLVGVGYLIGKTDVVPILERMSATRGSSDR